MVKFLILLKKYLFNRQGITAIEYSLAGSVISIGILGSMTQVRFALEDTYECISDSLAGSFCSSTTSGGDASKGWGGNIPVRAGRTYEITVPPGFQYALWDNPESNAWLNPNPENTWEGNIGLAAVISDKQIDTPHIWNGGSGSSGFQNYNNRATFKDGKITITAEKDGFLNAGIIDIDSFNNWTTTDGGKTKSRDIPFTVTRVK